jgi:hypothetical protein
LLIAYQYFIPESEAFMFCYAFSSCRVYETHPNKRARRIETLRVRLSFRNPMLELLQPGGALDTASTLLTTIGGPSKCAGEWRSIDFAALPSRHRHLLHPGAVGEDLCRIG